MTTSGFAAVDDQVDAAEFDDEIRCSKDSGVGPEIFWTQRAVENYTQGPAAIKKPHPLWAGMGGAMDDFGGGGRKPDVGAEAGHSDELVGADGGVVVKDTGALIAVAFLVGPNDRKSHKNRRLSGAALGVRTWVAGSGDRGAGDGSQSTASAGCGDDGSGAFDER